MRLERPIRALTAAAFVGVLGFPACEFETAGQSAVRGVRTIHTAQVQYYSQFHHYATSLSDLGPPATRGASASAAGLIGADLASGKWRGYIFRVTGSESGYVVEAIPAIRTGFSHTFYSDQTMVIHQDSGPDWK